MIISDKGSFSLVFDNWKTNMQPPEPSEFSLETLLHFWQPEWSRSDIPHPLVVVSSFDRFICDHATSNSPATVREAWEQDNRKLLAILDTMTASQESAYWHNRIKEEWEQLEQKIDDFTGQTEWGIFEIHKEKFLSQMEKEFVKYKTMSLNLFALRRTGELVRAAHLYRNFQEPQAIIKQWLQPDWEVNALQELARTDGKYTGGSLPNDRAFSPLDYFSTLAGKPVFVNAGNNDRMRYETPYLNELFLKNMCLARTEREAWSFWAERSHTHTGWPHTRREMPAVKGNRMAHELFTMVFSCVWVGNEANEEKTGFWLTAPNAACMQMWLDLEQEFQQELIDQVKQRNLHPPERAWNYCALQRGRLYPWERLQQKLEINLRLAVKHKETLPENYMQWQNILSSDAYRNILKNMGFSAYQESEFTPLHREYLLRYGLDWPFLEEKHLPCTQGTFCAPKGVSCNAIIFQSFIGKPLNKSQDKTLEHELSWRIGAADMRIHATLSTPEEELATLLAATEWAGEEIATLKLPVSIITKEFFRYDPLSGNQDETWYTYLHQAYTEKWGMSQEEWDAAILVHGLTSELSPFVRGLTQYWLSSNKWDFYHQMKQNNPDLDEDVLKVLDTVHGCLGRGPNNLLELSNKRVGNIDKILPENDPTFRQHLSTGLGFIRFNAVLNAIILIRPLLDGVNHIPDNKNIEFAIDYIIKNLPERYSSDRFTGLHYKEIMPNVVKELEQEAFTLLGYADNEISESTKFGHMGF